MTPEEKAAERARVEAFLAELSALCTRHGMYVDAIFDVGGWGDFFGAKFGGPTTYQIGGSWSGGYEISRLEEEGP